VILNLFQGHGVIIDTLDVLYAQLTRDLFAIAKFLLLSVYQKYRTMYELNYNGRTSYVSKLFPYLPVVFDRKH